MTDPSSPTFEVATVAEPTPEQDEARRYWSDRSFDWYKLDAPWSAWIAEAVLSYAPSRVFEFGCNVGRNLREVRRLSPDTFVSGIDINGEAVAFGREERNLPLAVGGVETLGILPDAAFDVCFTVSVLDHIATPSDPLRDLGRIAAKAVLLLEPWVGEEGKIVRNVNPDGETIDTTPYSYSWDYERLAAEALPGWQLTRTPMPLGSNLGEFYELFTLERPGISGSTG